MNKSSVEKLTVSKHTKYSVCLKYYLELSTTILPFRVVPNYGIRHTLFLHAILAFLWQYKRKSCCDNNIWYSLLTQHRRILLVFCHQLHAARSMRSLPQYNLICMVSCRLYCLMLFVANLCSENNNLTWPTWWLKLDNKLLHYPDN